MRVVLTGAGICSAAGHSLAEVATFFAGSCSPFVSSEAFGLPGYAVCPVSSPDADGLGTDDVAARLRTWRRRACVQRGGRFALAAALRAVNHAGFSSACPLPPETPVLAALGPMLDAAGEPGLFPLRQADAHSVGEPADAAAPGLAALWLLRWLPNTTCAALNQLLGLHGEALTVNAACASATQALGQAFRRIATGETERLLVMAGDSRLSAHGLLGYAKARALCRRDAADASRGPRPFAPDGDGFAPGEGGAAFVLESLAAARARGAAVLAEVLGYGASCDGGSLTAPDPSGHYAEIAVRAALKQAGLAPESIDWIAAHGTGTPLNAPVEAALLARLFGNGPAVLALKSWLGHTSAACGALELACVLACREAGFMPPIRDAKTFLRSDVRFVRTAAPFPGPAGLVESFGFGGQNAALVLRLGEPEA